jgi:hypothetical protein
MRKKLLRYGLLGSIVALLPLSLTAQSSNPSEIFLLCKVRVPTGELIHEYKLRDQSFFLYSRAAQGFEWRTPCNAMFDNSFCKLSVDKDGLSAAGNSAHIYINRVDGKISYSRKTTDGFEIWGTGSCDKSTNPETAIRKF